MRRQRGRPHNNGQRRPDGYSRNQNFASIGPEGRTERGTAMQIYDKYIAHARDAVASGDRILAESYLQHAEHFIRAFNTAAEKSGELRTPRPAAAPLRPGMGLDALIDSEGFEDDEGEDEGEGIEQPSIAAEPADAFPAQQQQRPLPLPRGDMPRGDRDRGDRPDQQDRRARFEEQRRQRGQFRDRPQREHRAEAGAESSRAESLRGETPRPDLGADPRPARQPFPETAPQPSIEAMPAFVRRHRPVKPAEPVEKPAE